MKKVVALFAAVLLPTAFAAGTTSTPITVNANVVSSCIFDTSATSAASFTYNAVNGTSGAVNGSATLYCNSGTAVSMTSATSGTKALSNGGTASLNTSYTLGMSAVAAGTGTGTYAGADKYTFTLAVTAASGQWGVPTASNYTNTVDINVSF
ncbi:hypothetical protein DM785_17305 (plasmid) [Deinococcus actinosclerus]|nr:hypothetical protein DM785_17305 [Deinococcus actinosclerus]